MKSVGQQLSQRVALWRGAIESRLPVAPTVSMLFWLWLSPRLAMRTILDLRPGYLLWPLAVLNAVLLMAAGFQLMGAVSIGTAWTGVIFIVAVVHAVLYLMYVPALPYWMLNRCVKKPGRYRDVQSAFVWGVFPLCVLSPLGFPLLSATARMAAGGNWVLIIGMLLLTAVYLLLWAWAVVILIRTLAEAMRISAWASFGLMVLFWVPQSMLYFISIWPLQPIGILIGRFIAFLCGTGLGPACTLVEGV